MATTAASKPALLSRRKERQPGHSARIRFVATWLTPIMLLFAVLSFLPIGMAAWLSFHEYSPLVKDAPFIGLRNYTFAFSTDPFFFNALFNTLRYAVVAVPLNIVISLPIALGLNSIRRFSTLFRIAFFAPVTASVVAAALVWLPVYDPQGGWLNSALNAIGLPTVSWLADPTTALWAVMVAALWQDLPYNIIVFLAGLQSIPGEFLDAAKVDGAGTWARFRYVTFPLLQRTFLFVLALTMISYVQQFTHVQVMTQGGPIHSSETLLLYIYQKGFRDFSMGYASAMSMLLMAILLVVTLVQLRVLRSRWEY